MIQHYSKLFSIKPLLLIILLLPITTFAQSSINVNGLYFKLSGQNATLIGAEENKVDVIIPETIEYENVTYTVTSVSSSFRGLKTLSGTLYIPKTVVNLDTYAFMDCTGFNECILEDGGTLKYPLISGELPMYGIIVYYASIFKNCKFERVYLGRCFADTNKDHDSYPSFSSAKTIVFGPDFSSFYINVFANANASKVYSLSAEPATLPTQKTVFSSSTYSDATLYVPTESVSKYQNAKYWKNFKNIVGIELYPQEIEMNRAIVSLDVDETAEVEATFSPADVYYDKLTWHSADESIATVENGIITAIAPGETTIEAETKNGLIATCHIIVNSPLSGIESIATDSADGSAEYFNMQGLRVKPETPGIYIRRQGSKSTKVIVK